MDRKNEIYGYYVNNERYLMPEDNTNNRKEMPKECDGCGALVELKCYDNKWLCRFCAVAGGSGGINGTLASMFNELLKALKET